MKRTLLILATLLICSGICSAQTAKLKPKDIALLDSLTEAFLFNPIGCQRVDLPVLKRSVWAQESMIRHQGWLSQDGKTVYFTDGDSVQVANMDSVIKIDFVEQCKAEIDSNFKSQYDRTFFVWT